MVTVESDSRHARPQSLLLDSFSPEPKFRRSTSAFGRNHAPGHCTFLHSLPTARSAHSTVEIELSWPYVITDVCINHSVCADPSSTDCIHPKQDEAEFSEDPDSASIGPLAFEPLRVRLDACTRRSDRRQEGIRGDERCLSQELRLSRLWRNSSECDPSSGVRLV
jgi:hypothetical protein